MSDEAIHAAAGEDCHLFGDNNCGFEEVAPGVEAFFPDPILEFGLPLTAGITKYTLLLVVSVLLVMGFWYITTRKSAVVPGRLQSVAEMLVTFIRDQVTRQQMGKEGDKYLPLMVTLFLFLFSMNVMGIIPGLQLPVTSHIAFPAALAVYVYVMWNAIGIKRHGVAGHFVARVVPGGAPKWILPLLVPIEIAQNFIARPVTHALRPFAAMLSGHLLLAVFAVGGWYMLNLGAGGFLSVLSVGYSGIALVAFIVFTGFELFIMALQAYVFIMLASSYLGEALEGAH
ncbi:F-type H+-transporting ATPase subunit a [Lipingzhangella halophila]|uniref:ATP synthase subunit a n=1 Tax=Lipingzhangella halophila TaxID=1783352 RepID=A0A7W7RKM8_9ACTN|nr:F0F1 ATP synthase subunit A [Lipingzhangella halophila]MBB4933730.1 F-type H+-transporting ATPase subunit a [Lipingzhangella halophila]